MGIALTPDLQYRLTEMVVHASEVSAEITLGDLPTRLSFTSGVVYGSPLSLENWSLEAATYDEDELAPWELALNLDGYDSVDHSTDGALVFTKGANRLTLSYAIGPRGDDDDSA
ncbi:MAG: hypothetical protein WCE44_03405 [Candidatus Velthaea sp.]|jgi:hypothetical protein